MVRSCMSMVQTEEQEEALNIKLDHASLPDETLLELAARSVPVPFHSTVRRKINRVAYGLQVDPK